LARGEDIPFDEVLENQQLRDERDSARAVGALRKADDAIEVATDGAMSIIDMGSVEGTYVNGKRVNKGQLTFGDEIRVGGTTIRRGNPAAVAFRGVCCGVSYSLFFHIGEM